MEIGFVAKIEAETGHQISSLLDQHVLSGMFNKYRPSGNGLEQIFAGTGVEGEVRSRVKRVFEVTAPSWNPNDIYFIIRNFESIDRSSANKLVREYLSGLKRLAEFLGDDEVFEMITSLTIVDDIGPNFSLDDDAPTLIYECITDFLAKLQPDRHELFILKEALYSMANDYFLVAYMLWPVIQTKELLNGVLDSYFDIWRFGIKIDFAVGGLVYVRLPAEEGRKA